MTVPESAEPSYSLTPDPGEVDVPTTDPATHEHSDLREFLVLLRRHTLLIAFVAIATAGVARKGVVADRQARLWDQRVELYVDTVTFVINRRLTREQQFNQVRA